MLFLKFCIKNYFNIAFCQFVLSTVLIFPFDNAFSNTVSKDSLRAHKLLSETHLNYESMHPDTALLFYKEAAAIAESHLTSEVYFPSFQNLKKDDNAGESIVFRNLLAKALRYEGIVHQDMGRYDQAIQSYLKSLKLYEALGGETDYIWHETGKNGMARCYNNIGIVHSMQDNPLIAINYFKKALKIFEEIGERRGLAGASNNIGLAHKNLAGNIEDDLKIKTHYKNAIQNYLRALKVYEELSESSDSEKVKLGKKGMSQCYNNVGAAYSLIGKITSNNKAAKKIYSQAIDYYNHSLRLRKELGDKNGISLIYGNISLLHLTIAELEDTSPYLHRQHISKAIQYGEKAYAIAGEFNSVSAINRASNKLYKAYQANANYKKAMEYADIYITTQDSLFNKEKTKYLTEMEIRYETDKKQLEIEKLKQEKLMAENLNEVQQALNKKQKTIIIIILALFLIVFISSIILIRTLSQKRKAYALLAEKNAEISHQKEEIEAHKNNLEDIVADRTKELEKALKSAEQSDQLKSSFLATMSHELRTPLNSIIGFSDLIKEPYVSREQVREYGGLINKSGIHLLEIIESLLAMSTLHTGSTEVITRQFRLSDTIISIYQQAKNQRDKLDKNALDIRLNFPEEYTDIELETDKTKLTQVFFNFINNAFKFTSEGYIEIGCIINNNDASFYVKDTGIGIDKEKQQYIFEMFRQGDESINRNFEGLGVGLAICSKISELLNGNIHVESEPKQGSVFYFTLPNAVVSEEVRAAGKSSHLLPNEEILKGKRILVAEDYETNRLLFRSILKMYHVTLIEASNGKEALALFKKEANIDLILMDIKMPVMNGIKASAKIHKIDPDVPVIALTAYAYKPEEALGDKACFADYLLKPVSRKNLMEILIKYLT